MLLTGRFIRLETLESSWNRIRGDGRARDDSSAIC